MADSMLKLAVKMNGDYVLAVFVDRRTKLIEIPLGTDEKTARKRANDLVKAVRDAEGIDDTGIS